MNKREGFNSKLGIIAVAAGSAIGLGNIWRFPYIVGENGGGAFLLIYLLCVALLGLPLMITELAIGRRGQANAVQSFKNIKKDTKWGVTGLVGIIASFLIFSFYAVIAGWVLSYIFGALTGSLGAVTPGTVGEYFGNVASSSGTSILATFIVISITTTIVAFGVEKGLERYSKILMPLLLILLTGLMIRSLTLDGAMEGVSFLFKPDFSKINSTAILEALGHAFYSLSLGMAVMLTYGSYISKKESIPSLAVSITIADTLIAIIAGLVIFPAVFAYGLDPQSGPALIFQTLPVVFNSMKFGTFFAVLFFTLIAIAAITSTISLMETSVSYFMEKFKLSRKKAAISIGILVFIFSIPCALSAGILSEFTMLGRNVFDFFDYITANYFLPIGGLLVCIFAGWVWKTQNVVKELSNEGEKPFKLAKVYSFIIRFVAPILIIIVFLSNIIK